MSPARQDPSSGFLSPITAENASLFLVAMILFFIANAVVLVNIYYNLPDFIRVIRLLNENAAAAKKDTPARGPTTPENDEPLVAERARRPYQYQGDDRPDQPDSDLPERQRRPYANPGNLGDPFRSPLDERARHPYMVHPNRSNFGFPLPERARHPYAFHPGPTQVPPIERERQPYSSSGRVSASATEIFGDVPPVRRRRRPFPGMNLPFGDDPRANLPPPFFGPRHNQEGPTLRGGGDFEESFRDPVPPPAYMRILGNPPFAEVTICRGREQRPIIYRCDLPLGPPGPPGPPGGPPFGPPIMPHHMPLFHCRPPPPAPPPGVPPSGDINGSLPPMNYEQAPAPIPNMGAEHASVSGEVADEVPEFHSENLPDVADENNGQ